MLNQHLEKRIGKDRLALLDSVATRQRFKKWSRFELEIIINEYQQKVNYRPSKKAASEKSKISVTEISKSARLDKKIKGFTFKKV